MKITVNKDDLKDAIDRITRTASIASDDVQGIYFMAKGSEAILMRFDRPATAVCVYLDAEVEVEGAVAIAGRIVTILNAMPAGEQVTLDATGKTVQVSSGSIRSRFAKGAHSDVSAVLEALNTAEIVSEASLYAPELSSLCSAASSLGADWIALTLTGDRIYFHGKPGEIATIEQARLTGPWSGEPDAPVVYTDQILRVCKLSGGNLRMRIARKNGSLIFDDEKNPNWWVWLGRLNETAPQVVLEEDDAVAV